MEKSVGVPEYRVAVYVITLTVFEASVEDSGAYTCLAVNDFGQAKANLKLDLSQGLTGFSFFFVIMTVECLENCQV